MWRIVYRSSIAKQVFLAVMRLLRKDSTRTRQFLGQKLNINPCRSIVELRLEVCGIYEPEVAEYLMSALSEGMTVVDIGSHIGCFTILASRLVGPSGRVVCYEPDPATFDQLRQNIRLNHCTNVIPIQCALSNVVGKGRMSSRADSALNALTFAESGATISVNVDTLDESLRKLSIRECNLVKMDIEGAEVLAIEGMEDTIARNPSIEFVIEVHTREIERLHGTVNDLFGFFVDRGFTLFKLSLWGGLKPLSMTGRGKVVSRRAVPGHILCRRYAIASRTQ